MNDGKVDKAMLQNCISVIWGVTPTSDKVKKCMKALETGRRTVCETLAQLYQDGVCYKFPPIFDKYIPDDDQRLGELWRALKEEFGMYARDVTTGVNIVGHRWARLRRAEVLDSLEVVDVPLSTRKTCQRISNAQSATAPHSIASVDHCRREHSKPNCPLVRDKGQEGAQE